MMRWGLTNSEGAVGLSTGVRPLLAQLFRSFAEADRRLLAPRDVYPVYLSLANEAGVELRTFPTVPRPALPPLDVDRRGEVLLVPEPLVPLGRGLNDLEAAHLQSWLSQDRERLLILDCVYTFSERFTKAAEKLLAGGQTILLHSLAKGFLAPDVAGFAMGPAAVIERLVPDIGDDARGAAAHLLREASDLPTSSRAAGRASAGASTFLPPRWGTSPSSRPHSTPCWRADNSPSRAPSLARSPATGPP
jgi:aspartate/methionine/tyrosine aminotransferase